MRTALTLTMATLLSATAVREVVGDPVTFIFAGEISVVDDENDLLGGAVSVGTPFSGLYTFGNTSAACNA